MGYFYVVLLLIFDVFFFFGRVEMKYTEYTTTENRVQWENEDMLPDS